ncbi:MAG: amino acid ABC transporter substrate-binding protein [Trueperaceae bacterium]|nr:amino acid ABC transporter substrate-binding protein [Trueperaceae bacterium]
MTRSIKVLVVLVLAALVSSAFSQSVVNAIRERGALRCGVNANLPGFGYVDASGDYVGFDIDFCKAIAAAVLGDADAVIYRPLTAGERPTALQSGEIDVLIRNTTWTSSRDTAWGADFAPTTFFDGQGFMVRRDSGINSLRDFEGRSICVQSGTTTETNLGTTMAGLGVQFTPVIFETSPVLVSAYDDGQCDGWTTDSSGLVSLQQSLRVPDDHKILPVLISKEPLGPAVLHGDDQWFDIVKWTVFALFNAEELGVTQANVDNLLISARDPQVLRLLGAPGNESYVEQLGLSADAFYNAISAVGNYGEIFERHLGSGSVFQLERGLNAQYYDGGLLYGYPFN